MLTLLAILVASTQVSMGAYTDVSEEVAIHNEIMDNVSAEYAKCAVYYSCVSAAMGNAENPEAASNYKVLAEGALSQSLLYAKFSRTEEMSAKIVDARVDIFTSRMLDEIDKNYSNLEILFVKYHDRCDFVIRRTDELLEEWEVTIRKEHGQD